MPYKVNSQRLYAHPKVIVVGCGGTGGFVAEGLRRKLAKTEMPLILVDYKTVRPHNLRRQHYFDEDKGRFKSQVMAERLTRLTNKSVGYSTLPYQNGMIDVEYENGMASMADTGIIIGCVDGPAGRRAIAENFTPGNWWIDAGNSYSSGQVLIGNAPSLSYLTKTFDVANQTVSWLPIPSLQIPNLLQPSSNFHAPQRDCDEAVDAYDQSDVINMAMATLVLQFFDQLITGTLTSMGAYIDLEEMTLSRIPAEPEIVSRMFGLAVDTLTSFNKSNKEDQ